MKHPSIKNKSEQDAFTDLLFNALLGFALMFAVAFMLMSTPEKKGKIETKAEYLITVRWEDKHPDDVDAIVEWCLRQLPADERRVLAGSAIPPHSTKLWHIIPAHAAGFALKRRAAQEGKHVLHLRLKPGPPIDQKIIALFHQGNERQREIKNEKRKTERNKYRKNKRNT